ncbi:multicopper oxidase, putative [Talaromyces marneffei ATCC 18224]|uniref:Multicopper oxidase, putative n=2 Tax=Talaromyces marneffei TaxID=37727 RepID=B6QJH9_TALMQ|nr:multicopper oxidase, putative [Talaromyces marneffei ATCC 18224]
MQYGTGWYHSHYSLQYINGAYGPVVIHGPTSTNYDHELEPLLISDWYHADAFSMFHEEITDHAHIPTGTLMNGKGVFDCDPDEDTRCTGKEVRHEIVFEPGKKHKLRLVNSGSLATYKFWMDGHNFTVVANDFVPIEPYVTDVLILGIGIFSFYCWFTDSIANMWLTQRYDVIIEANATLEYGSNFWMHATHCDDEMPVPWDTRIGIIRYNTNDKSNPYTPSASTHHPGYGCRDPDPSSLRPIVKRQVGKEVNGMCPSEYLKIGLQSWPNISDPDSVIRKWVLANRSQSVDWHDPSLMQVVSHDKVNLTEEAAPINLDYETGEWVYFVIEGNFTDINDPPRPIPRSVHPIHLHGHDFVILAQGDGEFTSDIVPNLNNPARRDRVNCPIGGYV